MTGSSTVTFTDPEQYQVAIRPSQVEVLLTANGNFHSTLTRIELPWLWMQSGRERLPRVAHSATSTDRPPVFFLADAGQPSMRHSGRDLAFGEIAVAGPGQMHHHRTEAHCHWASFLMTRDNLTAAGDALVGRDLIESSVTHYVRPPLTLMSRLLNLQKKSERLAESAADILAQPEAARALEHALVHAMIMCLDANRLVQMGRGALYHTAIIARFEEVLAANYDRPLHLAEICTSIGVTERTLRASCIEHLGMGPVRYLCLRRLHLVRHALIRASSATATVTQIATGAGFFELGRFAGEYRALFGETPSATLRRSPEDLQPSQNSPFAFVNSEFA